MKLPLARIGAHTTLALALLLPLGAWSQASLSITMAPPPLPLYAQPVLPGEGYIWTPGYWAWNASEIDYYWVPGTWVLAPNAGDLWTPGYWAFENAGYFWHIGYWGSRVGFYGGVNYGYGYTGTGYQGGHWDHGAFEYNRAASNVGRRVVRGTYSAGVVNSAHVTHVSFNGGQAGAMARPTDAERQLQTAEHAGPSADQQQHERAALAIRTQRSSGIHGAPIVAATPRPSAFTGPGVEHVRGGSMQARPERQEPQSRPQAHEEAPHQGR